MGTTLEACRVLAVLDDALQNLSALSVVSERFLENATASSKNFPQDLQLVLRTHSYHVNDSKDDISKDEIVQSTVDVIQAVKKLPSTLKQQWEPAFPGVTELAHRLQLCYQRRLGSTAEEDRAREEHFEEVCKREKKAAKEQRSLEHQLALERRERSGEAASMAAAQHAASSSLADTQRLSAQQIAALEAEAEGERESKRQVYLAKEVALQQQASTLTAEFTKQRAAQQEEQAALQKRKALAEEEVEVWLQSYEEQMGAKRALTAAAAQVEAASSQLLQNTMEAWETLVAEREARAEAIQQAEDKVRREREHQQRLNKAASVIQAAWRGFTAAKAAKLAGDADPGAKKKGAKGAKPGSAGKGAKPGSAGKEGKKPGSAGKEGKKPGSAGKEAAKPGSAGKEAGKPGPAGKDGKPSSPAAGGRAKAAKK